jgi:hypothetical protein
MSHLARAKEAMKRTRQAQNTLPSEGVTVFEFVGAQFKPVEWADFVRLTPREICRRPLVLKACDLYFLGDGWGTEIGRIVAKKHPGKVRHLGEWLWVVVPGLSSEMMDKRLLELPMRAITDGDASNLVARIRQLTGAEEALA